jgi:RHS repeat-associated protein
MKHFYIAIFSVCCLISISGYTQSPTEQGCEIRRSGSNCVGQAITFYPNCPVEGFTTFSWYIDGTFITTGSSYTHTFTTKGTHTIKLGSSCGNSTTCDYPKPIFTQTSIFIEDVPKPAITASTKQLCETGNVTLSIVGDEEYNTLDYTWRSVPSGYSAMGRSVTFNNISATTTFYVTASGEACISESSNITVTVGKTELVPELRADNFYHRKILAVNTTRSNHYWEKSSAGTDLTNPVKGDYTVYESGDYYIRYYSEPLNCWASANGPVHVDIDYTPPLASVVQVQKAGYNEIYLSNDEKDYILSYADYYWVNGTGDSPSIARVYSKDGNVSGSKIYANGTYYLKGRDRTTGTWGPTLTIVANLRGDEGLNWVNVRTYDGTFVNVNGNNTERIAGETKSYYGKDGQTLQSQTRNLTTGKILTAQQLRDQHQRVVGETLPAPVTSSDFSYNAAFVLSPSGDIYDHRDFDGTVNDNEAVDTRLNPLGVGNQMEGTVGWYYSSNNNLEEHVPQTNYPYSRVEFYNDGTGEEKRASGLGDMLRLGTGHEVIKGTFPVFNELGDYLSKRLIALPGIVQDGNLMNEGVQTVMRDQNGKYTISVTDKSGKTLLTARAGSDSEYILKVQNSVTASGAPTSPSYQTITYFYILQEQPVSITGSTDFVVENIVTEERKDAGETFAAANGKWPAGFYKITLTSEASEITLSYANHYLDVAYQFYDDMGRLVSSVSPNGMKAWLISGAKYTEIDKTTYQYNFKGWLLSMKETDAGESKYQYRKDGKIRFSQNAQQFIDKHFSYTRYDAIGRPLESGEYIGTQYIYASLSSQLEFENQVQYTTTDTRDWISTHYDYPDAGFNSVTNLGSTYAQEFTSGAVSWSENANMKTWYSYDELGRVTWMIQKPTGLDRLFAIKYTYNFIGNVLKAENLSYSLGGVLLEQFYHYYEYDADSRLSKVYTSVTADGDKKLRATYTYYLHGPLKRIELADKLQGIDFVYNIQGWLTQINHPDKTKDPGKDSDDVFGMILNYYEADLSNVFGKNEKAQMPDLNSLHHLPQTLTGDEMPTLAFDPKTAYRENMQENLKQLQSLYNQNEQIDTAENVYLSEPLESILYTDSKITDKPDFGMLDSLAVASVKPVLYNQAVIDAVPDDIEYAALKDIFISLGGTAWAKKTNWPVTWPATATSTEFSKWFGVVVSNGDVVSLSLPSNNLVGTIPSSIANLSQLTSIYMQGNSISGSIPTEIGSLSKLTLLYLYTNKLTGTIPASLGNLKNLVYLYLLRNTLTGSIPSELSGMTALQFLRLEENSLSGNLPASIGSMTNLVQINLYDNAFTGPIPAEWNALTNLTYLNLYANKLSGDIPVLDKLTKLVTFDLRMNSFTGDIPLWISTFTDLENLYLGANKLTGTIPASLGTLHKLKALTLNTNTLKGTLPPSLGELSELQTLYVNQNQLSGELPPSYGLLSKLQTFHAGENKLTGNIPASYSNLKELQYFNVANNLLSGELPDIFNGWTKATSFYISTNKFTGAVPVSVGSMTNLTYCYLSNNAFTEVPVSLLNLKKAVYIILEGNKLHDIPDFTTLPTKAVLYLYVRNNYLDAADLEPLYSGVNTPGFKTLMATPQFVDPGMRISVPQGEALRITAGGKTANTSFVWEKQSGTTWTDVTSANQSASPDEFVITGPAATDAGIYRYKISTSKITALSIISNSITVQTVDALPVSSTENQLYNGLISSVQWRTDEAYSAGTGDYYGQYKYAYDDKYQLLGADYADFKKTTRMFESAGNNYRLTGMNYDPNGNILSLKRYDADGLYKNNLSYSYVANTNKLDRVTTYVNKFTYNAIGQMTGEDKESDADQYVEYDVTGKVRKVYMDAAKAVPNVEYLYDDRGFRLTKIAYQEKRTTWYIRDASGNILSIYEQAGTLPDSNQPIQWGTLTQTKYDGTALKVASGYTSGSAASSNTLAAGQDGSIEYTVEDYYNTKNIGLRVVGSTTSSYVFSFNASPNKTISIRVIGNAVASFGYNIGDKLKLVRTGAKYQFYQNGALKYEYVNGSTGAMEVYVALNMVTSVVSGLTFKSVDMKPQEASLTLTEVPLYGSGKLGTYYPAQDGSAAYEITDHLGNVRALVRENVNIYTATMEDNGTADLTNPRVTEMNYFQNIFETEVKDVQMNHTKPLPAVESPDKAAYLYWVSGTQGMDVQDKSVGPAIALKVNAGDKVNLETWARYEDKQDYTEDISLMMFSQLLGTSFAYVQGFDAMSVNQASETFRGALPALFGAGVDASQPRAFLNYIVFNTKMEYVSSDRVQVSEAAGFEPDERAVPDMFEKLAMNVTINEPGYIYAWVSNGSENTKVWFDDLNVTHTSNFVTQATDFGAWGDVLREQKTDESLYRYSYQGQFAEKDLETGWNHFELREYDPIIGRWAAMDPKRQHYSSYVGMGNNPISRTDPDGGLDDYIDNGDGTFSLLRKTDDAFDVVYSKGSTYDAKLDMVLGNIEGVVNKGFISSDLNLFKNISLIDVKSINDKKSYLEFILTYSQIHDREIAGLFVNSKDGVDDLLISPSGGNTYKSAPGFSTMFKAGSYDRACQTFFIKGNSYKLNGWFHTHPASNRVGYGYPNPSPPDQKITEALGVKGWIYPGRGGVDASCYFEK